MTVLGRIAGACLLGCAATLSLSSCTLEPVESTPGTTIPSGSVASSPARTGAEETVAGALEPLIGDDLPSAVEIVAALRGAGYQTDQVEVSADHTPTGLAPDSMWAAVRIDENECVIAQFIDGVQTEVAEPINGACLIGETVTIDW